MAGWEFHVKQEEGSLMVELKGDPERMQARREAVNAFFEFRDKARAAGMTPGCLLKTMVMGGAQLLGARRGHRVDGEQNG